jgi:hypothetical protein
VFFWIPAFAGMTRSNIINVAVYNSTRFHLTLYPHSVDRKLSCKKLKSRIEKDFQNNCFHLQVSKMENGKIK